MHEPEHSCQASTSWLESRSGRRDPLIPPPGLWFVGGGNNYELVNEEFLRYFIELGGLEPSSRVLDVGCGLDVMAARLTRFLQPPGSYCGMDIVKVGVEWAQRKSCQEIGISVPLPIH